METVSSMKVRGYSLSVARRLVSEEAPTVFFLHGSMGTKEQFSFLLDTHCFDGFNLVAHDALGCGGSEKPHLCSAYSTPSLAEDAIYIVKTFASGRNILVGHSFGCAQAARVYRALQREVNIEGMILLSGAEHMPSKGHAVFTLPLLLLRCLEPVLSSQFMKLAYSPHASEETRRRGRATVPRNDMFVTKAFYRQSEWANAQDWRAINCPVLLISGEDDKITPLERAERLRSLLFSNINEDGKTCCVCELVVVKQAGHQVMLEKPEEVADAITRFLRHIDNSAGDSSSL